MPLHAGVLEAQDLIPHDFQDLRTLQKALIAGDTNSNEREGHRGLAQLGDQLIGTVLMSEGFDRGLNRQEQQNASSHYRSKEVCSSIARAHRIDSMIKISDRQKWDGPQPTVLKNTLAAIIGAVWVDSRSHDTVRKVMAALGLINDVDIRVDPQKNHVLQQPEHAHHDGEVPDVDLSTCSTTDMKQSDEPAASVPWQLTLPDTTMSLDATTSNHNTNIGISHDSLCPINDVDIGVDPRRTMCYGSLNMDITMGEVPDINLSDWLMTDMMQSDEPTANVPWQLTFPDTAMSTSNLDTNISISHDSLSDVYTPATTTANGSAANSASPRNDQFAMSQAETAEIKQVSSKGRLRGFQQVLRTYIGEEKFKISDKHSLDAFCNTMSEYQHALDNYHMKEPQKKSAAKIVVAIGDCSAFTMLRNTLRDVRVSKCSFPVANLSTSERLRKILKLECSAENTRLLYWLHLCVLTEQLEREVDEADMHDGILDKKRLSQDGNPQNRRQKRISQLMLLHMPSGLQTEAKTKELRRRGQRLLLLNARLGRGILAVLGAGFNTYDLMSISDAGFHQLLDLVIQLEGTRLRQICRLTEPIVQLLCRGVDSNDSVELEEVDDEAIQTVPRLSPAYDTLLSRKSGIMFKATD